MLRSEDLIGKLEAGSAALLLCSTIGGCATGDTSGGGDTDSGTGGETGGGDLCDGVDAEVVDCNAVDEEFALEDEADQIPGCFNAAVGPLQLASQTPGLDFNLPGIVQSTDPALVGAWSEITDNDLQLAIHSVHRPTGTFLQFGDHGHGGSAAAQDKTVWYPPAECSPFEDGLENCEVSYDLDPTTPEVESHVHTDLVESDLFCSGHVNMPPVDAAELLRPRTLAVGGQHINGGNNGIADAFVFSESLPDVAPPSVGDWDWQTIASLAERRWYPTITVLSDGRFIAPGGLVNTAVFCGDDPDMPIAANDGGCRCDPNDPNDPFVQAGICEPNAFYDDYVCDPDKFDDDTCWDEPLYTPGYEILTEGPGGFSWAQHSNGDIPGVYPQMFVIPDLPNFETDETYLGGKYISVGRESGFVEGTARLYDPSAPDDASVDIGGASCTPGSSAVMYEPGKFMKFGGGSTPTRVTEILDLTESCPMWRRAGPTGMQRRYSSGVLLPDGSVMATGGTARANTGDVDVDPLDGVDERYSVVFTTDLFSPSTESWCRLADLPGTTSMPSEFPELRGYHSQSFLLPDGRIYLGSGGRSGGEDHFDYHLYSPPYLFWGPRPQIMLPYIANGIAGMSTGSSFSFDRENSVPIDRVTLVKLSSATHQWDMEQRFVELDIVNVTVDEVTVDAPPSTCYATPGYYMLFAISDAGVPSVGQYVAVDGNCVAASVQSQPPVPPESAPMGINDFTNTGFAGLRASCAGEGSTLELGDFGRELTDLCAAIGGCPTDGTINVETRLASTTGSASVAAGDLLDDAAIRFVDGVPTAADPLLLNVAGTEFNSNVDLGPGDHVLDICGSFLGMSACVKQPLRIDPVVGPDAGSYRAGAIELRNVAVDRLPNVTTLALGDDDVVSVDLPEGFSFPFFGTTIRELYVGANGGVRVSPGGIGASNGSFPNTGSAPHIAPFWDDLDPSLSGSVRTYFDGARFIVAWENVAVASGGHVTVQLHIYGDGRIEFHYPNVEVADTSSHAAKATIGIQDGNDHLTLSVNDGALLSTTSALALEGGSCIASALRFPDSGACNDQPSTLPLNVEICGASDSVEVSTPALPTTCDPHEDAFLSGGVFADGSRLPVDAQRQVQVFAGEYEAHWQILAADETPTGLTYLPFGDEASQPVVVTRVENTALCCAPGQDVVTLTTRSDRYTAKIGKAKCVAAQSGNDRIYLSYLDDTVMGQEGADTIDAGDGSDLLLGGSGSDHLLGRDGDDELLGGANDDVLDGGNDSDQLWGGEGADTLLGRAGADVLVPGPGLDFVDGGKGNDSIVILDLCEIERDTVLDGGDGSDTLWLPPGASLADVQALHATVNNIETVATIEGGAWGDSECAP